MRDPLPYLILLTKFQIPTSNIQRNSKVQILDFKLEALEKVQIPKSKNQKFAGVAATSPALP